MESNKHAGGRLGIFHHNELNATFQIQVTQPYTRKQLRKRMDPLYVTRKYLLHGYILGVLTHPTA